MVAIDVLKFPTSSPADTTPLRNLKDAGYDADQIIAVIGKTEVTIFSGGTEGVLCPHVTFIVRCKDEQSTGMLGAVGHTRDLEPHEVGRETHARTVADTVQAMMSEMDVGIEDVKLVLVKCPLLTSAKIEAARVARQTPICTDTYESMAKSRYASAIGIGLALGEIPDTEVATHLQSGDSHSALASCSSGAELDDNHIFILASDPKTAKPSIKAVSRPMKDSIDAEAVMDLLGRVKGDGGEVIQVFVKAEADPGGLIRGNRHTMNTDSDIHSTRHARAAVGGLLAGLVGAGTMLYVSGGAEGQGPPGGGSLCIVYRVG